MSLEVSTPTLLENCDFLHREMPWIALSPSAELPRTGGVRPAERQRVLNDVHKCEQTLAIVATLIRRRESVSVIDPREIRNGWRKFFLAHSTFFHIFCLLADVYKQCTATLEQGSWPLREIEQACALWRLAGSLMLYGVDFSPTETIYQDYIRPRMPEAFSGTWLREYALLSERRRELDRALEERSADDHEMVRNLRTSLSEGQRCYHNFHFQVMLACVPDLTSKLQEYQMEHGRLIPGEQQYEIYDEWFHIVRLPAIDLSSYARSACALFSEVLADLAEGTFLEPDPLASLNQGISTALEILRAAVGTEILQQAEIG